MIKLSEAQKKALLYFNVARPGHIRMHKEETRPWATNVTYSQGMFYPVTLRKLIEYGLMIYHYNFGMKLTPEGAVERAKIRNGIKHGRKPKDRNRRVSDYYPAWQRSSGVQSQTRVF